MAFVRKIPPGEADGLLERIYRDAVQRAGKVFEILQVQSLDAKALQASIGLYAATTVLPGALPRWFRELLAVTVSRLNHCHY
jgi:alkylhydroperoxidase family enzyme